MSQYHGNYLVHDNLDDRKSMMELLHRLPPFRRVAFLEYCCRRATMLRNSGIHPGILQSSYDLAHQAMRDSSADDMLTLDLWYDLWVLCAQYNLDIETMLAPLVDSARLQGRSGNQADLAPRVRSGWDILSARPAPTSKLARPLAKSLVSPAPLAVAHNAIATEVAPPTAGVRRVELGKFL